VQPAFQVGKADRHRLDALFVGEVLHPLVADLVAAGPGQALGLGLEVHLFQAIVGDFQKISEIIEHRAGSAVTRESRRDAACYNV